jgi:hypothetical protein
VSPDEPGEDERLGLGATVGEAAFELQDVEALLHGSGCRRLGPETRAKP